MIKSYIFTRVVYTTRPLQSFTAIVNPVLETDCIKSCIFYANSRLLVDRYAEQYGEWLDKSSLCSDYLKITGPMKKAENACVTQLFCKVKTESDVEIDNVLNPQVFLKTLVLPVLGLITHRLIMHSVLKFHHM